jgi:hypothetical protein
MISSHTHTHTDSLSLLLSLSAHLGQPEGEGFVAFVSPRKLEAETCTSHLLDRAAYSEYAAKRARGEPTVSPLPLPTPGAASHAPRGTHGGGRRGGGKRKHDAGPAAAASLADDPEEEGQGEDGAGLSEDDA